MRTSIVQELKQKVLHSGNSLNLFIALNIAVFLVFKLLLVIEVLSGSSGLISGFIMKQFMMPASLNQVIVKPWTILTYMFTHEGFFHVLFNMLWLFWLGRIFLDFLNNRQFVFTYIAGGVAGALLVLLVYALHPVFNFASGNSVLLGASASVSAIIVGVATLVPDYTIRMLFFGNVKLKYLALAFVVLSILGLAGGNAGGNFAHLGGAVLGFFYIRGLSRGNDFSRFFQRRTKRAKFKVYKNERNSDWDTPPNQDYIDQILDKISQSGYKSLSKKEKDALFKASERDEK